VTTVTVDRPSTSSYDPTVPSVPPATIATNPAQVTALLDELASKGPSPVSVGVVAHRASVHPEGRTIDLIDADPRLELHTIFAPEHGLTGSVDAGAVVADGIEPVTGVAIASLYGQRRQPEPAQMAALDVLVYDLQDVGVRTFTYIATLGLVMEAAAGSDVPLVVVDRENPQGATIDGPPLSAGLESFISPYPIPLVYGLTSGELAAMIADRAWIDGASALDLTVVGPTTALPDVWIPPSPNLPTLESAWLYPAVVAFEATTLSVGRGTDEPFALIGGPGLDSAMIAADLATRPLGGLEVSEREFVPRSIPDMASAPRYEGRPLAGIALGTTAPLTEPLRVSVELLDAVMDSVDDRRSIIDRPDIFDRLVGSAEVRIQLLADTPPDEIAAGWRERSNRFGELAAGYR
jgi:uncharacterized protein YbbC (DUF1343 family)